MHQSVITYNSATDEVADASTEGYVDDQELSQQGPVFYSIEDSQQFDQPDFVSTGGLSLQGSCVNEQDCTTNEPRPAAEIACDGEDPSEGSHCRTDCRRPSTSLLVVPPEHLVGAGINFSLPCRNANDHHSNGNENRDSDSDSEEIPIDRRRRRRRLHLSPFNQETEGVGTDITRQHQYAPNSVSFVERPAQRTRRVRKSHKHRRHSPFMHVLRAPTPQQRPMSGDVLMVSNEEPMWRVRRIVDSVDRNGKRFYKVRWADTWEPAKNLEGYADGAIAEFHCVV